MEQQTHLFSDLPIDNTARQHIRSMAGWALVVVATSVIGYILSLSDLFSNRPLGARQEGFQLGFNITNTSITFACISIAIGLIYNFFLFRFGMQARSAVDGLNQAKLNSSFGNLKTYFVILSILFVIFMLICILGAVALVSNGGRVE